MRLTVNLEYKTGWGEGLVLCLGGKRYPMYCDGNGKWTCEVARFSPDKSGTYSYEVIRDGITVRKEWREHRLSLPEGMRAKEIYINDRWTDRPADAPLFSSAFTKGIFRREGGAKKRHEAEFFRCRICVAVPDVRPDEVLALTGSSQDLGRWSQGIPFDESGFPYWTLDLDMTGGTEYKMVIADRKTLKPKIWEDGPNRVFGCPSGKEVFFIEASAEPHFERERWRGAGTAVPVFSLRSEDDFGTGEFLDLKKMVDWAAGTGQSILQVLPINDTTMTWTKQDSYPYNAVSSFALHPMYINLPAAGVVEDDEYQRLKQELGALKSVDYERMVKAKTAFLRKAFEKTFRAVSELDTYKEFIGRNSSWLLPYAAFCVLRDKNGTADFSRWKTHAKYNAKKIATFCEEHKDETDFWCFVQYHLDSQLSEVRRYAHSKGVVLKGDIPIGISRTSVDAWMHPRLFCMDSQAGAPPDAFSADGQNWGFPTYDWEMMAKDGYGWWRARFAKMAEYFDAYRIDHILGFFRIWQIPVTSKSGLDGYFSPALPYPAAELEQMGFDPEDGGLFLEDPHKAEYYHPRIGAYQSLSYQRLDPDIRQTFDNLYNDFFYCRHNRFWKDSAMKKLPALTDSTGMLACGEDLGMIPASVPEVMSALRILSLEIQRMPKAVGETFAAPESYPYLSVCTTSTHDMNPIRAWWEENKELTDRYFHEVIKCHGQAPLHCEPWICRRIIEQHLGSPAMLTILPLQDWLSMDGAIRRDNPTEERINIPADPHHYWRYRMHLTIEALSAQKTFNDNLRGMITASGRNACTL